jgi:SAM-dependent methyltransferase
LDSVAATRQQKALQRTLNDCMKGVAAIRQSQEALQRTFAECLDLFKNNQTSAPAAQKRPKVGILLSGSIATPQSGPERTKLHNTARGICEEAIETGEDPTQLYQLSETILRETLLPKVGHVERALDIGCGNGRYTFIFGDVADEIFAFDISASLVGQAREEVKRRNVHNFEFAVADLESGLPRGPFDLIVCMGVLASVVDDEPYTNLINQLNDSLNVGGFLITKDTTSAYPEGNIIATSSYVRNYRHMVGYEENIKKAGFRLIDKIQLIEWGNFANHMYLWKKYSEG